MSGQRHGLSFAPEYRAWQTMRLRCTVPTNPAYAAYGGRSIRVCDRWMNSVEAFIQDMGRKPSAAHELDRRDNDGNYEPSNCRWVLRKTNDRNRRSNRMLTFAGEKCAVAEWCERLRLPPSTVIKRLDAGWSVEEALTVPVRAKARNGHSKPRKRNTCTECGKSVYGKRCKSCENRRRAEALVRANVIEQEQEMVA